MRIDTSELRRLREESPSYYTVKMLHDAPALCDELDALRAEVRRLRGIVRGVVEVEDAEVDLLVYVNTGEPINVWQATEKQRAIAVQRSIVIQDARDYLESHQNQADTDAH